MPLRLPLNACARARALVAASFLVTSATAWAADTPIYTLQGSGVSSPFVGQTVTTTGVVTRVNNNGFFFQDLTGDGDPLTSDAVFVFTSTAPTVSAGQYLRLTAKVTEFNVGAASNSDTAVHTLTELTTVSNLQTLGTGYTISPLALALPLPAGTDFERYEGMLVRIAGPITVDQNYFEARYGQVSVSVGGRAETPTNRYRPGAQANALADLNNRSMLILDDGSSVQNPNPTPYFAADLTLRAGDTVDSLTGVIDYGLATSSNADYGSYKIHPTVAPVFARTNPRTTAPEAVGGNLKIASFNVLNFFTTFTNGETADGQTGQGCTLGTSTAKSNCRGADSLAEFNRQRAKIVEAIAAVNADALGLMEMQNNGATAVGNLVAALNAKLGAGTYRAVADPVGASTGGTGTDAIKVAMLYKPASLTPFGASTSDATAIHNRPPLAQTFSLANGEKFTLVVDHFKSKSSCPASTDADAQGNTDSGDGQGCWNARRLQQSQAVRSFVARLQAASGSNDVLLVGDFNAYAQEDPIADLTSSGYVDQIGRFNSFGYSYVFNGTAGRLDQAIATPSFSTKVSRAIEWHINADEPFGIDYNLEFKQPACSACAPDPYTATPYRASDHDPVVVGVNVYKTLTGTAGRDNLIGTEGDDILIGGPGADVLTGNGGNNIFTYQALRDAGDTITDFSPGHDRLDLRALLVDAGYGGSDALADGWVRVADGAAGAVIQIAVGGRAAGASVRPLVTLRGVGATSIDLARDTVTR